jgi:hypothetical protein
MSFLAPLYALGLLAISLPIVFHLIRRQPHGEFKFSSLMFLTPTPPRLARRSRLDNLLLLLLRGLALALLAFAFARPFLRSESLVSPQNAEATRTVLIVDTSASMRRGDLWQQAVATVERAVGQRKPLDEIAVYACDDTLRPIVTFEAMLQVAPAERTNVVRSRLKEVKPTWAATRLGQGLQEAVEIVNNASESRGGQQLIARRIVLVSDMQTGSRLGTLADFAWPEDVQLEMAPVSLTKKTNAGLHHVADADSRVAVPATETRVRVSNDADSKTDEFQISWLDGVGKPVASSVPAYVPAGESRVIRVANPPSPNLPTRLQLVGDDFDFDNSLYLAAANTATANVIYLGDDRADDAQGLRYYLERALTEGLADRAVLSVPASDKPLPIESAATTPLVVVTSPLNAERTRELRKYAESGGSVVVVLKESPPDGALPELIGVPTLDVEEANVNNYAMLGQIDFAHRLFTSMSGAHFNDFTQIHFWKYRRLKPEQLGDGNSIARFENGDPAVVEWRIGKGSVIVLTSGWQPSDSQFARSWKFVLFVSALFGDHPIGPLANTAFTVHEQVPIVEQTATAEPATVTTPSGQEIKLGAAARSFTITDEPGIYTLTRAGEQQKFAVNLDPLESKTAALGNESLEQLGVRLVKPPQSAVGETSKNQRMADTQLESRQKYWQWLIACVLALLVIETWLAGRASRIATAEGSPA